jgi:hypothetical protein
MCGCGPDLSTSATLSWIHNRIHWDLKLFALAESDPDLKIILYLDQNSTQAATITVLQFFKSPLLQLVLEVRKCRCGAIFL